MYVGVCKFMGEREKDQSTALYIVWILLAFTLATTLAPILTNDYIKRLLW